MKQHLNREALIFDPTREVPDAIKNIDIQKRNAKKRFEIRYAMEKEIKVTDENICVLFSYQTNSIGA